MTLKEKLEILRGEPIRVFTGDPMDIPCIETSDPVRLCKHPVVSVNMITYNHEPYIRQAIDGVMMQKTDFEFELVIGEDCSTDKTREICFEYQKRYPDKIRVLWSDHNLYRNPHPAGGNAQRNLAHCRGEFIALCEGDDWWTDPRKLQKQIDIFRSDGCYSIVYTDFKVFSQHVGKLSNAKLFESGFFDKLDSFCLKDYLTENFPCVRPFGFFATASLMYRKSILNKVKMNDPLADKMLSLGDYQLRTYAAMCGKVGFVKEPCAVYRMGTGVLAMSFARGDIKMTADVIYVQMIRTWDILSSSERNVFLRNALDRILRVERCCWPAKWRVLKFYCSMLQSLRWDALCLFPRLLVMFHVIPQSLMALKRKTGS